MVGSNANPPDRRLPIAIGLTLFIGALAATLGFFTPSELIAGFEVAEAQMRPADLLIIDENGQPIPGAKATYGALSATAASDGSIQLQIDQPTLVIVEAPGFISEPLVATQDMAYPITVALWARKTPYGQTRSVLQFGGDTMLGRRYLEPERSDTAVVDPEKPDSARAVVADIAPLMELADISSVNLESVVGDLQLEDAYQGKRYLLQSPDVIMDALQEMGIDVVTLGNNHVNDWQGPGLALTLSHLNEAGLAHAGAGTSDRTARKPAVLDAPGGRVAILSYTSVTGSFVNDQLPRSSDVPPADLANEDKWQYEKRPFTFTAADGTVLFEPDPYLIGDAWASFRELEPDLDTEVVAALWTALTDVFPELQDWVAKRNHGGAAWFRKSSVHQDIESARKQGAQTVIVQLHSGFQFAELESEFLTDAAHAAIDAGADLVIGHHPHVLQGFEWYEGRLIAYSLGNFLFDQDFLETYPSVILRTIFEGDQLLEAKVFPIMLDGYRPVPVSGAAADQIMRMLELRSDSLAKTARLPDGTIGAVVAGSASPAHFDDAAWGGTIETGSRRAEISEITLTAGQATLGPSTVVRSNSKMSGIWLGRDLYGWGSFEDVQADGKYQGGLHWAATGGTSRVVSTTGAPSGSWVLDLHSNDGYVADVVTRPVARIPIEEHRWFDEQGKPLDGKARWTLLVKARTLGDVDPFLRVDGYVFDDSDPNQNPQSTRVSRVVLPLELVADEVWHQLQIDIPAEFWAEGDGAVNSIMIYIGLHPPEVGDSRVGIDDIKLIEWREASTLPEGSWHPADMVAVDGSPPSVRLTTSR